MADVQATDTLNKSLETGVAREHSLNKGDSTVQEQALALFQSLRLESETGTEPKILDTGSIRSLYGAFNDASRELGQTKEKLLHTMGQQLGHEEKTKIKGDMQTFEKRMGLT